MCHDKFNPDVHHSFIHLRLRHSSTLSRNFAHPLWMLSRTMPSQPFSTRVSPFNPLPTCHSFPSAHGTAYACAHPLITSDHSTGEPGGRQHLSRRPSRGMIIVGVSHGHAVLASRSSFFSFFPPRGRSSEPAVTTWWVCLAAVASPPCLALGARTGRPGEANFHFC